MLTAERVRFIVSACLAGINCRYDGSNCTVPKIRNFAAQGVARPVCPELLGGLSVPRAPAEIVGGDGGDVLDGRAKVVSEDGRDLTREFIEGAERTLELALALDVGEALLKERSPSCGSKEIHQSGRLIKGQGVASALLKRNGIIVWAESEGQSRPI